MDQPAHYRRKAGKAKPKLGVSGNDGSSSIVNTEKRATENAHQAVHEAKMRAMEKSARKHVKRAHKATDKELVKLIENVATSEEQRRVSEGDVISESAQRALERRMRLMSVS